MPQVTANFSTNTISSGVVIEGEVLKGALEFFFKRKAPEDYLDHIYFADLGKNQDSAPLPSISSGNATFAAADISDSFKILIPGRIKLLVDSELEMGAPL